MDIDYTDTLKSVTDVENELSALLIEARSQINKENSINILHHSKNICSRIMKEGNPKGYVFMVETLSELAKECDLPSERRRLWNECISVAFRGIDKFNDVSFVIALSNKTVDFVQDPYVNIHVAEANHILSDVKKRISYFLNKLSNHERSPLLSRESSLLRNMARFQPTRFKQESMSQKALRCAEKAVKESIDSWDAYLELALSHWYLAQFDKGDQQYNDRINLVEKYFWKSISIKPTCFNLLSISRFFLNTYQTTPFLECYYRYEKIEYNKRRFLQGAYIYGDAVMQLWYSQAPSEIIHNYLNNADSLLEESISAKYNDARHIVTLAFIKAAKGDINVGKEILNSVHSLSRDASWTKIAEIVSKPQTSDDLITQGFVLGIAESSTWNKLGTFMNDFLKDLPSAIFMQKVALRLNPSNAVAMTNLARSLLQENTSDAILEAERWISKAASCADRRFRWWRNVREQIQESKSKLHGQPSIEQHIGKHLSMKHLSDIFQYYVSLKESNDPQRRGYQFEKLVQKLIKITLGNCFASYRQSLGWVKNPVMQIDAAFCFFDRDFYRVETKWTADKIPPSDIVLFREKLDAVGVKGLFISISGFTTEAIQKAYEYRKECQIILMDGNELELILKGSPSFDEAIRLKQIYFSKESNPYFKINPIEQIEVQA